MHKEEVEAAFKAGEGQFVEFKASVDKKKILETVSAFATTNDGYILIGIQEGGKPIGIDIGKKTLETLANDIKSLTDPNIYPEWIEPHKIFGKDIIAVKIKKNNGAVFF